MSHSRRGECVAANRRSGVSKESEIGCEFLSPGHGASRPDRLIDPVLNVELAGTMGSPVRCYHLVSQVSAIGPAGGACDFGGWSVCGCGDTRPGLVGHMMQRSRHLPAIFPVSDEPAVGSSPIHFERDFKIGSIRGARRPFASGGEKTGIRGIRHREASPGDCLQQLFAGETQLQRVGYSAGL